MFSLEAPYLGDSNEYTRYSIFNIYKRKSTQIIPNLQLLDCFKGLKDEFETAVVNEPSVFEPQKVSFFCFLTIRVSVELCLLLFWFSSRMIMKMISLYQITESNFMLYNLNSLIANI